MKKLFVINHINNFEKGESDKFEINKTNIEKEKANLKLDLAQSHSESLILSQNQKVDSFNESRKSSLNVLSTEISFSSNLNNNSDMDNQYNEKNQFLGKKVKLHFNVIKTGSQNNSKKSLFKKLENNLTIEGKNKKEILNIKKPKRKIRFLKKIFSEKNSNIKEGRWSLEERMKFIEALIENGKKWKIVQNYIGSRTCAQTRSHAQKFLLKLKSISNEVFNFQKDSIKNLYDIINEIKNKKGIKVDCDENDKKYLIDTLFNLSEGSFENNDKQNNTKENSVDKGNNLNNKEKRLLTKKEEKSKTKDNGINIDNNKSGEHTNNLFKVDNNINNNNQSNSIIQNKDENNAKINNKNISNSKNDFDDFFSEPNDQTLIFDDGIAFYINNNSIYNFNNISYYVKEYNFIKNIEKSKLINRYFFS